MWYAVSCKKRHLILSYENWSLHEVFCYEWCTQVSSLGLLLAVRGNKMLQTSDWKPSLSKPQLPVKDVYSTSRLPTMEKLLRRRPKWSVLYCANFNVEANYFPKNIFGDICFLLVTRILAVRRFPTWRLGGFRSSRGTMSIRKSNWSNFVMAMAMSFLCKHNRHRRSRDEVIL